ALADLVFSAFGREEFTDLLGELRASAFDLGAHCVPELAKLVHQTFKRGVAAAGKVFRDGVHELASDHGDGWRELLRHLADAVTELSALGTAEGCRRALWSGSRRLGRSARPRR